MIKLKFKASAIHLILSLIILGSSLLAAILWWYPEPFFSISGVSKIIIFIFSVDVTLGPLLTFIIYKPLKPSLKFDLTTIAAIQIAAFFYGVYTLYAAHPLYVAFSGDRFTTINAQDVDPNKAKYLELKVSKLNKPHLVNVKKPTDPQELSKVIMEALSGLADLDERPEYYEPLQQAHSSIQANSIPLEILAQNEFNKSKLDLFLQNHGNVVKDYLFLPLSSKEKDVIWVFNKITNKPIDIIDINPFTLGQK